ncbi:Tetratricopeptide-like helical [Macrophomina phaseolina MS6]|uniref:Tetratricopeptide-like helical n=1 Tax=Macrophomina phaseolina (strain MS6) TaxID=1126212 RepID=K2S108_MACPH|nr:Tetratricopeptide-like helical [Macrophomina phaseolina MS6]
MDRCHQWLRPCAMTEVHKQHLEARLAGTCEWIQTNQVFIEWKGSQTASAAERILRISGNHGCGKSVLASALVQSLEAEGQCVNLFAFSMTDADRQTAASVARFAIARSLKKTDRSGIGAVYNVLSDDGNPSTCQLWYLLGQVRERNKTQDSYVLDGLDEASGPPQEVINLIVRLLEQCTKSKCIILGRPFAFEVLPHEVAQGSRHIRMDEIYTGPDIEAFIDAGIGRVEMLDDPDLRALASSTLKANTQGMFLWGKLMLDELQSSLSLSQKDVTDKLQDLRDGLEQAYERAFNRLKTRLKKNQIELLRNVLTFTISARRPLRVIEMAWAHALQTKCTASRAKVSVQNCLLNDPEKLITRICGEFIAVRNGRVILNHSSIKDFLTREECAWDSASASGLRTFHIGALEANGALARICFEYLNMEDHGFPMREPETFSSLYGLHQFVRYASYNFVFHALDSISILAEYAKQLGEFCDSVRLISWVDHLTFCWHEDGFEPALIDALREFIELFDALVECGERIRPRVIAQIEEEISTRTSSYGMNDIRTFHLKICLGSLRLEESGIMGEFDTAAECLANSTETNATASSRGIGSLQRHPNPLSEEVPAIENLVQLLRKGDITKPQHQVSLAIGVFARFWKKGALDPLHVLYRLLLVKAEHLPAFALLGVGYFYFNLDKYERAVEICQKILSRVENTGQRVEAQAYELMGMSYKELGRYEHATRFLTLVTGGLEKKHIRNRTWLRDAYVRAGLFKEGLSAFEQIVARDRKKHGNTHRYVLVDALQLGVLLGELGRYEDAVEVLRHLVSIANGNRDLRACSTNLWAIAGIGLELCNLGRPQEAIAWLAENAMDIRFDAHRRIQAHVHYALGSAYYLKAGTDQHSLISAIYHLEHSVSHLRAVTRRDDERLCWYLYHLCAALMAAGRFGELLPNARRSLEASEKLYGKNHSYFQGALVQLAAALDGTGRRERARKFRRETAAGIARDQGIQKACYFLASIAHKAEDQRNPDEAIKWFEESMRLERAHIRVLTCPFYMRDRLFGLFERQEKYEEALRLQKGTAKSARVHFGSDHWHSVRTRLWLGLAFFPSGRYIEARGCLLDVKRIIQGTYLDGTLFSFDVEVLLTNALWMLGELEETLLILRKALGCFNRLEAPSGLNGGWVTRNLEFVKELLHKAEGGLGEDDWHSEVKENSAQIPPV